MVRLTEVQVDDQVGTLSGRNDPLCGTREAGVLRASNQSRVVLVYVAHSGVFAPPRRDKVIVSAQTHAYKMVRPARSPTLTYKQGR